MEKIIRYSVFFAVVMLLQILVFNNIPAIGMNIPYFYVLFLLNLPVSFSPNIVLFLAFICGFCVDCSINSLGVHASASVMMAFARPSILKILAPRTGYENNNIPVLSNFGFSWTLRYVLVCVTIHHAMLYLCFTFTLENIGYMFLRMIVNVILTVVVIMLTEVIVFKK